MQHDFKLLILSCIEIDIYDEIKLYPVLNINSFANCKFYVAFVIVYFTMHNAKQKIIIKQTPYQIKC